MVVVVAPHAGAAHPVIIQGKSRGRKEKEKKNDEAGVQVFHEKNGFSAWGNQDGVLCFPHKMRGTPFSSAKKGMKGITQQMLHRNKGNRKGKGIKN